MAVLQPDGPSAHYPFHISAEYFVKMPFLRAGEFFSAGVGEDNVDALVRPDNGASITEDMGSRCANPRAAGS